MVCRLSETASRDRLQLGDRRAPAAGDAVTTSGNNVVTLIGRPVLMTAGPQTGGSPPAHSDERERNKRERTDAAELLRSAAAQLERSSVAMLAIAERSRSALADLSASSIELSLLREQALKIATVSERIGEVIERGDLAAAMLLQAELKAERVANCKAAPKHDDARRDR